MYVKKIEWLDKISKEAIVEVSEGTEQLVCFFVPVPINRMIGCVSLWNV